MKKFLIKSIDFYQKNLSSYTNSTCKFIPTCSSYAKEAVEVHGTIRGSYYSIRRFLRCTPFNRKMGYDPVPFKKDIDENNQPK